MRMYLLIQRDVVNEVQQKISLNKGKMMRFKVTFLLGVIGLFSVVGCSTSPTSPNTGGAQSNSASISTAGSPSSAQAGYPQLLSVLAKTQAAVESNDFAKAQQEFDRFESVWAPVEDGIKLQSDNAYDAIEEGMDQVSAALKSSKADQAISILQGMNDRIVSLTPANLLASAQAGYPQLLSVLAKTQAAVESNDFAKAQQEFDQFESVWAPVEDGIKAKSDDAYDAIEDGMDQVSFALRSSKSDQAISILQGMQKQIQSIPQG